MLVLATEPGATGEIRKNIVAEGLFVRAVVGVFCCGAPSRDYEEGIIPTPSGLMI